MFDIRAWGERIAAENAQNGARARWELYQGEEGRLHYELDRQMAPLQTWAENVTAALQEAVAQVAEAFRPVAQAITAAVRDLAELVK